MGPDPMGFIIGETALNRCSTSFRLCSEFRGVRFHSDNWLEGMEEQENPGIIRKTEIPATRLYGKLLMPRVQVRLLGFQLSLPFFNLRR